MRRPWRFIRTTLLLLIASAIVNIAIAWGCALFSAVGPEEHVQGLTFEKEYWFEPSGSSCAATKREGRGVEYRWGWTDHRPIPHDDMELKTMVINVESGLPSHSLVGTRRGSFVSSFCYFAIRQKFKSYARLVAPTVDTHTRSSIAPPESWQIAQEWLAGRFLPAVPLWPGFAINTIFYAAILWLLFFIPGKVRRAIRRRRGLCPACAYPVGTSPVCTECGKELQE